MKTKEEGLLLNRSTRFSTFTLRYRSDTKKCHQEISRASLTRTIDRSRLLIFSGSLTIIYSSWIPAISTSRLKASLSKWAPIFLFFKQFCFCFSSVIHLWWLRTLNSRKRRNRRTSRNGTIYSKVVLSSLSDHFQMKFYFIFYCHHILSNRNRSAWFIICAVIFQRTESDVIIIQTKNEYNKILCAKQLRWWWQKKRLALFPHSWTDKEHRCLLSSGFFPSYLNHHPASRILEKHDFLWQFPRIRQILIVDPLYASSTQNNSSLNCRAFTIKIQIIWKN